MREYPSLGFGVWGLGFGVWGLGFGVWGLGFGVWGLGFILLLLIVLLFGYCTPKEEKTDSDVYYTCSMDPQVVETKPGNCPICKMPLTPVKKDQSMNEGGLHLSDQQIQLGNINTDILAEHELGDEIQLTGKLSVDQNKQWSISSRVMGRIDKLYIKNAGETN
jgi:Cu(I)/Ag(I) efflux system membrane fusion protein